MYFTYPGQDGMFACGKSYIYIYIYIYVYMYVDRYR